MEEVMICIRCGAQKDHLVEECDACKFNPFGDEMDEVKSIYLSTLRFEDEKDKEEYAIVLRGTAQRLKEGSQIEFPPDELHRLGELRAAFLSVTPLHLLWYLFRLFWPVLALLAFLYLVYLLLSWYNAANR
jgi:hypothetical protein